ncbi:MAG: carboxypeptidase regulatory-like domain-containing protein [Planctomycetota bacterium]|nr:carboxypeptidase regulatory-like domain-containing protein [Planctomycetota bacterium]
MAKDLPAGQETRVELVLQGGTTLRGKVVSATDQKPISGATVSIPQTQLKSTSDAEGRFALSGVPAAKSTLRVTAQGYEPKELAQSGKTGEQDLGQIPLVPWPEVRGVTRDATDSKKAVPQAALEVQVAGQRQTLTSGADGGFSLGKLPPGSVELTAKAQGYQETRMNKQVQPGDAWIDVPLTREPPPPPMATAPQPTPSPVPELDQPPQPRSPPERKSGRKPPNEVAAKGVVLRGDVVDAVRKQPVPGAEVRVSVGGDRRSVKANAEGHFEIRGLPSGLAEVQVSAAGFEPAKLTHPTGGDDMLAVLSPAMKANEIRIVLTWAKLQPRLDLDGHLYGGAGGSGFHVHVNNRNQGGATLDIDAKNGPDPETITARTTPNARYSYYIVDDRNRGTAGEKGGNGLAISQAQVRLYYRGARSGEVFQIPRNPQGPVWHVFDISVTGERSVVVVPVNKWLTDLPAQ